MALNERSKRSTTVMTTHGGTKQNIQHFAELPISRYEELAHEIFAMHIPSW